jgi:hypothetical protein
VIFRFDITDKGYEVTVDFHEDNGRSFKVPVEGLDGLTGKARDTAIKRAAVSLIEHYNTAHLDPRKPQFEIVGLEVGKGDHDAVSKPPPLAVFCISLLAPKNTAQAILGDLQELFHKNVERFDEKQARRMYWMEVVANVRPLLLTWLKRIGFFTLLIDYVRSKSGF